MAKQATPRSDEKKVSIEVLNLERGSIRYCLLGRTPIMPRTMSSKAKKDLLYPPKRKTQAERAVTLKHDPYEEFRTSGIMRRAPADTLLAVPGGAFKKALCTAALDIPGATKSQLGRLVRVEEWNVGIWGIPFLSMAVVRSADIGKTPDIRTRVIVPEWAAVVTVSYQQPMLTERVISTLLGAAGEICGVGDWRQEKGSGSCGLWEIVNEDDADFARIVSSGGREAQEIAMKDANPFDEETEELLSWFNAERARRTDPKEKK